MVYQIPVRKGDSRFRERERYHALEIIVFVPKISYSCHGYCGGTEPQPAAARRSGVLPRGFPPVTPRLTFLLNHLVDGQAQALGAGLDGTGAADQVAGLRLGVAALGDSRFDLNGLGG